MTDKINTKTKEVYFLRNTFWRLGDELLDSESIRERRFGQFITELGYMLAYDIDIDRFADVLREGVNFAIRVKFEKGD